MSILSLPRKKRNIIIGGCMALFSVANFLWNDVRMKDDGVFRVARNLASDNENLEMSGDRPVMCTFFEPIEIENRRTGMMDHQDEALIKAWRESWEGAGWKTKVLSLKDAKQHPHYEILLEKLKKKSRNNKQENYENLCFLRWLAIAAAGGGWMSDYDVFPLSLTSEVGRHLPNDGAFTAHDGPVPSLLSGSHKEWDRMAHEVINAATEMTGYISDMMALQFIVDNKPDIPFIRERDVLREVAYSAINKVDCAKTKGMTAVHLSHRRMYEAWEKGLMPHLSDFHDAPGERPDYSRKFLSNFASQCGSRRPIIYTYVMPEGPDGMLLPAQNEALINLWTKIWGQYGWQARVLTEEDAKMHPKFEQLNEQLQKISNPEQRLPYYRFIAMATTERGGWYSDYDTFPLYMGGDDVNLPNEGSFTIYDGFIPSFMSARSEEWNRVTDVLISMLEKMDTKDDFDVAHIMQDLLNNEEQGPSVSNNQVYRIDRRFQDRESQETAQLVCGLFKKRRAAHFKFAILQADILYAAPLFYDKWQDTCIDRSKEGTLSKSTQLMDKMLSTMFEH